MVRAAGIVHGKTSLTHHDDNGVFRNQPTAFPATRYHFLVVLRESILTPYGKQLLANFVRGDAA